MANRKDDPESEKFNTGHVVPRSAYFGPSAPPSFDPSGPMNAEFPPTVDGQLARMLVQEWLDANQRRQQTQEQLSRLASLVDEFKKVAERLQHSAAADIQAVVDAAVPRHRNRIRPEWDTYAGFRQHMCDLARQVLEQTDLVTKEQVAALAGCNPVTITRHMKDFGLNPKHWPPSTWPDKAPSVLHHLDGLAHVLAAALPAIGLLDQLADGKFDMVMNMLRMFGCHVGVNLG